MKFKFAILLAVIGGVIGGGIVGYLIFTGPRMRVQPLIKTFQAEMPAVPANIVPTKPSPQFSTVPETSSNPLLPTGANIDRGGVYYQYYCVFCHGEKGDGNGPVGESYTPIPTDLRSEKVVSYSDSQLYTAMLSGTGHAPVLERVVLPEHRWYLVLYVRFLGGSAGNAGS